MAAEQNVTARHLPSNCRALIRQRALERFRYYVTIDTRSDPQIRQHPSSDGQWDLARILRAELDDRDGVRAALDDQCYLDAHKSARHTDSRQALTFCAHLDTSPSVSGAGVVPVIHRSYDGGSLHFPDDPALSLSPADSPELTRYIGEDIVTASGNTLRGADDRAGLAAMWIPVPALEKSTEVILQLCRLWAHNDHYTQPVASSI